MARKTRPEIEEILTNAIAAGRIWNVELEDLQYTIDQIVKAAVETPEIEALDRVLREEEAAIYEQWVSTNRPDIKKDEQHLAWMALSKQFNASKEGKSCKLQAKLYSIQTANLSVMLGYCQKRDTLFPAEPRFNCIREALASIESFVSLYAQAKTIVVKGRKPSETPSLSARTIENTGTCGCCSRNIKLYDSGRIWDHGYSIEGRGYHGYGMGYKIGGSCFGTGYEPIEVSCEVWKDMLVAMERRLLALPATIEKLKAKTKANPIPAWKPKMTEAEKAHKDDCERRARTLRACEADLRTLPEQIPAMKLQIGKWAPRPLPGA